MRHLVVSAAVISLLACEPGATAPSQVNENQSALLNAPVDTNHPFDVGVCQGVLNTDPAKGPVGTCRSGTAKCSGTLIAPNLVLTARHCVVNTQPGPTAATNPCDGDFLTTALRSGGTHVTTSPSVFVGAPKWYEVSEVLVPENNTRLCEADLALLVLATSVPRSEARPVAVDASRDIAHRPPRELAIVGRGSIDETFTLDANGDWTGGYVGVRGDLLRRVAQNIPFWCATNGPTKCTTVDHEVPTTHTFIATSQMFLAGIGAASGDSGAGVLDQKNFNRRWRKQSILGVASWNFIGADGKPAGTGTQRLDSFPDFFRKGAERARQLGGYDRRDGCEFTVDPEEQVGVANEFD